MAMIWMSNTAVSAAARGQVFTQSFLFLMAASSDESGKHGGVREDLDRRYIYSQIPLILLVITASE